MNLAHNHTRSAIISVPFTSAMARNTMPSALTCQLLAAILLGIATLLMSGCGQQRPSYSTLVQVGGQVTLDGNPYAGAVVEFSSSAGILAAGSTDENGHYSLSTARHGVGVPAETYVIRVRDSQSQAIPLVYSETGVKEVVIPKAGPQTYDLTLKSNVSNKEQFVSEADGQQQ